MSGLITPALYSTASRMLLSQVSKKVGTARASGKKKKGRKKSAAAKKRGTQLRTVKVTKAKAGGTRVSGAGVARAAKLKKGSAAAKAWGKKMAALRGKK